jgi:hypothetical protein
MENLGAVKELHKVVGRLQTRINELERVQQKVEKFRRDSSVRGSVSSQSTCKLYRFLWPLFSIDR